MIDVPIERGGFGFPDDVVPMHDFWQLPAAMKEARFDVDLERPDEFRGEYLWLTASAAKKQLLARALPQLGTVRFLAIDAYTIPQEVIDSLATMKQLERLSLAPTRTKSLSFLDELTRLEFLHIEAVPNVDDLSPIMGCENLMSLCLGTSVSSLDAFVPGSLPGLRCLVLEGTGESKPLRLQTLQPLQNLQSLEYVCPLNCRVADKSLGFALQLPKFKALHVYSMRWWDNDDISALLARGVRVTRTI